MSLVSNLIVHIGRFEYGLVVFEITNSDGSYDYTS